MSTERLPQPALAGTQEHRPLTETRICPSCDGAGWVAEGRDWDPESGRLVLTEIVCPRCNGAGTVEVFRYPRPSSRTRLAPCCGCGARLKLAELVEVTEDDPSLTALAGDRLCAPCAGRHGIQR